MDLSVIGWREAILLALLVAALYFGVASFRLLGLRRRTVAVPAAPVEKTATPASDALWRAEIDDELRRLNDEVSALRQEISQVRALRSVAPQYGDAVGLAQQGMTADAIAERCGISVGEAELILALARKPENQ